MLDNETILEAVAEACRQKRRSYTSLVFDLAYIQVYSDSNRLTISLLDEGKPRTFNLSLEEIIDDD